MTQALIQAHSLSRWYSMGGTDVFGLCRADLDIPANSFVVVKGSSGSGKTTLLSLLAGLDRPSSGSLTVDGRDLNQASEPELTIYRRQVVGMVFQSFNLLPTLTVLENVMLPGLLAGSERKGLEARARDLLEWLGLTRRWSHLPNQLSGGEMQRTSLARAVINDPLLILADEPTGNLDTANGRAVVELLSGLQSSSDHTVIVATHSSEFDQAATVEIQLVDGRIEGSPCTG
jgi:putative ABC transport system ATP-binding protein